MKKLKIALNTRIMNLKEFKKFASNKQAVAFWSFGLTTIRFDSPDIMLINKSHKFDPPLPHSYSIMANVGKLKSGKSFWDVLRWQVTSGKNGKFYVTRKRG